MIDPNDQNGTIRCFYCCKPVQQTGIGRTPVYCSNACRQSNYRLRKNHYDRKRLSRKRREIQTAVSLEQFKNSALTLRNVGNTSQTLRKAAL